jgi:hypothetical protein
MGLSTIAETANKPQLNCKKTNSPDRHSGAGLLPGELAFMEGPFVTTDEVLDRYAKISSGLDRDLVRVW